MAVITSESDCDLSGERLLALWSVSRSNPRGRLQGALLASVAV